MESRLGHSNKATPSYIFVSHKYAGRFSARFSEKKNEKYDDVFIEIHTGKKHQEVFVYTFQ